MRVATPTPAPEAVEAEQAADAEHGEEAEQHRGRRHTGDVEAEVDGAKQAAEDVVERRA